MSQIANVKKQTVPARTAAAPAIQQAASTSISASLNAMLDSEGYRKRFNDLLGKRAPQFVSSLVSMINADTKLQEVFASAPLTIIQSALKAASFDLPIEPSLGYAYVVPFTNNKKTDDGRWEKRKEAIFVMGYKGMIQLAERTGAYERINVVDVREGELVAYDRLREDVELSFVEDEDERDKLPIIGWVGYFRLRNGMEKCIYMSRKAIDAHEKANRKGPYMGKGWQENYEAMASKTILRRLIGKWGMMSIDYQRADDSTIAAATALATGKVDDLDEIETTPDEVVTAPVEPVVSNDPDVLPGQTSIFGGK